VKPTASQKFQFQRDLCIAWIVALRISQQAEACVAQRRICQAEPRRVEGIECLHAKLQRHALRAGGNVLKTDESISSGLWSAEIPFSRPIMPNQALEALAFNMLRAGGQRFLISRHEICQAIGNH
jgi:hypothetical protein